MSEIKKMKCPCCEKTMVAEYDICNVCLWENDPIQQKKLDFSGGANVMSLNEAKKHLQKGNQ
ncbi:MAG: hypothetical protein LUC50_00750 [Ruminococcus sp.]|nr:hypothetical protein [Ruminococcus sp.]